MESRDSMGLPPTSGASGVIGSGPFGTMLQRTMSAALGAASSQVITPSSTMASSALHTPPAAVKPAITMFPNTANPYPYTPEAATPVFLSHSVPSSMNMAMVVDAAGGLRTEPVKRKRGRPRKYGPDGRMALALAPLSTHVTPVTPSQKRGRGRPPGSGKKQQLAALGGWLAGSAGVGFTPHVITIAAGEDVATRIMSFSQQGPRAICILSANGAISNVTLRQPAISGGTVTYEGRFEILSLSGSFLLTETEGTRSRTGGLSVSLASRDGRVIGGGVAGLLMAASPVQVVVGSFLSSGKKIQPKPVAEIPSGAAQGATPLMAVPLIHSLMNDAFAAKSESPSLNQGTGGATGSSNLQHQMHATGTQFQSVGWPASQAIPESRHTDINISLPGG